MYLCLHLSRSDFISYSPATGITSDGNETVPCKFT